MHGSGAWSDDDEDLRCDSLTAVKRKNLRHIQMSVP